MFDEAARVRRVTDGRYAAEADDTWRQGPGVYGGLVAAWLVGAFRDTVGDTDRPIRTLTAHYAAPVPPGPLSIETRVERVGGRVTQMSGRVVGAGSTCVTALATFAADRNGPSSTFDEAPALPPFSPEVPDFLPRAMMPAFARHHLDYRFLLGSPPYSGAAAGELGGWCRMIGGATPDRATLAALLDAWPPAIFAVLDTPRPATTVDLTMHFLAEPDPGLGPDQPYAFQGHVTWADTGYAEEVGSLWDATGRLLGRMRQWRAVLGAP